MCHLRGLLMLKLNRGDQAKNCFMEALALDVKCYEAFEQLISGEMMTPIEGLYSANALVVYSSASSQSGSLCKAWLTKSRHQKMQILYVSCTFLAYASTSMQKNTLLHDGN
jgi:anaphase-promoting complex subunit 6